VDGGPNLIALQAQGPKAEILNWHTSFPF
jgi:hypothetical protein